MDDKSKEFNFLKQNKLFHGLTDQQLNKVISFSQAMQCKPGEFLIREGEAANQFYLIQDGTVEILKNDLSKTNLYKIGTLGPGEVVGEIGLISDKKRTASIRALTPVALIAFSIKKFHTPETVELLLLINRNISEILIDRLDYAYTVSVESVRNELKKSKKISLYQFIILAIMLFLIFELGMTVYTIFYTSYFCNLKENYPSQGVISPIGF